MIRVLYSWLLLLLSPILLGWMGLRARRAGGQWQVLGRERFGRYPQPSRLSAGAIWVHAVSLGETRAAIPLVQALLARGHPVLLTHLTATGRAEGARAFADPIQKQRLQQAWLPHDFPGATRRFLRHFKPVLGVLIERELWPNLVWAARRAGMPLVLANARMSAASLRRTRRLDALLGPLYASLAHVYAQTLKDARRLEQAGAVSVSVSGNFKFDVQQDAALVARGRDFAHRLGRPIVVIASTREGEDARFVPQIRHQLEQARSRTLESEPPVLFMLVPRHPQRFDAAAELLQAAGLRHVRRTRLRELGEGCSSMLEACRDTDVVLGDTLGEMAWYYACSQVAIVGGSFAPLGGQNFIEASALGCPVVVGPHTAHFEQAVADALQAGAIARAADPSQALRQAMAWVDDRAECHRVGQAARHWVGQHAGAVQRVINGIEDRLR